MDFSLVHGFLRQDSSYASPFCWPGHLCWFYRPTLIPGLGNYCCFYAKPGRSLRERFFLQETGSSTLTSVLYYPGCLDQRGKGSQLKPKFLWWPTFHVFLQFNSHLEYIKQFQAIYIMFVILISTPTPPQPGGWSQLGVPSTLLSLPNLLRVRGCLDQLTKLPCTFNMWWVNALHT